MQSIDRSDLFYVYRNTAYFQAKGVRLCLHIGTTAYCFGYAPPSKDGKLCCRVELLTPERRFRVSWARW